MQKENIIINLKERKSKIIEIPGQKDKLLKQIGMIVHFSYFNITDAKIEISCNRMLSEEEIKDKIIEVLQ